MEESYETFEEELGPQRAGPPPQKPVHRRPGGKTHIYTKSRFIEQKQITSRRYSSPGNRNTFRKAFSSEIKQLNQNISSPTWWSSQMLVYLKRNNVCYTHHPFSRLHLHSDCVVSDQGSYFSSSLLRSSIYRVTQYLRETTDEGSACVCVCSCTCV